jgi:hypothetical protein
MKFFPFDIQYSLSDILRFAFKSFGPFSQLVGRKTSFFSFDNILCDIPQGICAVTKRFQ